MNIIRKVANSVDSMINFTADFPSNHSDGKMPVLDLKVRLNPQNEIQFEFYEKPTSNEKIVLASSALSWAQKRNICTQEALRRLRNTSPNLGSEVQNFHLTQFMIKMQRSGYSEQFRLEVLKSAKSAFQKMIDNDKNGSKPLYRNRAQILEDRRSKNIGKQNWWKKKDTKFKTILFVPPTPGSSLAKQIRKREEELNQHSKFRIKVVERGGVKLKDLLVRKNPFKTQECHRKLCPFCKPTKHSDPASLNSYRVPCSASGVGYEISCKACQSSNVKATYQGETGRLAAVRGIEHIKSLNKNDMENPLVKHKLKEHPNQKNIKFEFRILATYHDPLTRQANEGVRIKNAAKTGLILNSKSEFNHPPTNRVIVENSRKSSRIPGEYKIDH